MGFSTGKKLLVTKRNMRSGSGALSTWGTNLSISMDFNGHPCSFLDAHLNRVSKYMKCDDKSCYEETSVFVDNGSKIWD